jgi:hypothetical protein
MKTTTESDIPQLFRQFSGNSANYQELTRAAAARASQARWPLLSAVELEQGDIPAVIDPETGLAMLETTPLPAKTATGDAATVPFAVLTEIIPDTAPTTVEILAQANDEGVKLSKDEILALVDIDANYPLEMPVPVIVPGTNTIFMPPAPFSARHFAQVERALAARREAATGDSAVQAEVAAAPLSDIPAQTEVAEAALAADAATDAVAEQVPATTAAPSDAAVDTLTALSAELAAAQRQEAAATPVVAVAKVETPPAAPQIPPTALAAAVSTSAPKPVETAVPTQVAPAIAAPSFPASPAPAKTPAAVAQAAPAKPLSTPISQPAAPVAMPPQAEAAAPSPLRAYAPSTAASRPLATASDASPVKHAGLQPLFQRLAAPEETASPVKSLFSRLLQS